MKQITQSKHNKSKQSEQASKLCKTSPPNCSGGLPSGEAPHKNYGEVNPAKLSKLSRPNKVKSSSVNKRTKRSLPVLFKQKNANKANQN